MVFAYPIWGVIGLNAKLISFVLPHWLEVSALRMLSYRFSLIMVRFTSGKNVSFGSKVISRILSCYLAVFNWLF